MKKSRYDEQIEHAAGEVKKHCGFHPEKVHIYTTRNYTGTRKEKVTAYLILPDYYPYCIACDVLMEKGGIEIGFELAYFIYTKACGDDWSYQDHLRHHSL